MRENQYSGYDPQDIPSTQMRDYSPQADELASYIKKCCRRFKQMSYELKRRNDIEEIKLRIRLAERAQGRRGIFDCDCAAMLRELESIAPQSHKQKHKKLNSTIFDWE